ncbi:FAD-dependent monooxygenase [Parvularcula marina]|uniref:2-octaprenyl-6-methoxyphenyl hydroxylase n=1 Tax=Parvularcula marina TaxID=2292771 RepID=A0A371RIT6_9PROT|nr:FAD-dependent monooxygenase [Parvularcula marina]RFB05362.1 2-octaprenyl-6-methoxyphenyl hydroxylase [Parvularcula marina]
MDKNRHDVAIAGAGLTGQLMALALSQQGFSVALIDPHPADAQADDPRTTALAYASVRLFKRLGLWEALEYRAAAINDILVTNGRPADRFRKGGLSGGRLHFPSSLLPEHSAGPEGTPLGHIVRNADMLEVFRARLKEDENVDLITDRIEVVENKRGNVTLPLGGGRTIEAAFLIACDGKQSRLRETQGFRTRKWGYDQKALAFNLKTEKPHHGVAQEIFYPQGPFAILPLQGNEVSIVWTEKNPGADHYARLPEDELIAEVRARVGDHLGQLELSSKPAVFPLTFVYVNNPVEGRIVLAGDAYHGIHPIAGQGFNLGIKDIAVMADVLHEARSHGLDVGAPDVLANYVRWRRFDSAALSFGTDAMTRLFSNDIAPVRWARGAGLGLVQHFDPARVLFMRQAGADTGELPRLMRP